VVSSQSAAPHGTVVLLQAAAQQFPVPLAPQIPEAQSKSLLHGPVLDGATQLPFLQVKPEAQSDGDAQLRLQLPASAQPR